VKKGSKSAKRAEAMQIVSREKRARTKRKTENFDKKLVLKRKVTERFFFLLVSLKGYPLCLGYQK
jgi:hypothetical protein